MPDNNPTLMSGIFFVSANSRADCANFSGERRLLACWFRRLAETIFSESIPRNRIRCRQAAGNRRLAFCATQSSYLREETVASRNKGEPAFSFFRRIYSAKPENADRSATSPKSDPGTIVRSNAAIHRLPRQVEESVIIPVLFRCKRAGRLDKSGLHQRRVVAISDSTPRSKMKFINEEKL